MPKRAQSDLLHPTALTVAINLGNSVLARLDDKGQPDGITVQLARKIADQLGVSAHFITYPTAGKVVDDADKHRWDMAFLAIDPKRQTVLSFTEPYLSIEGTLLVNAASPWQSVKQMDRPDVVINVGKGAAYDLYLSRTLTQATLNRLPSSQQAISAFLQGEGDMAAGVRQPLAQAAKNHPQFRVLKDSFTQINQAICVPNAKMALHAYLCTQIKQWQQDGTITAIVAADRPDT
ncbi:transporter substrate-binding domain-containing protein [Serratia sp. NPDC078593]|uniref:transporter substrate-binding domain-containing protein n=1 Tax=unclassified Serratia (in: enterobacteria) TaxID=2647522 RepID=UPI0037CDC4E7